MGITTVLGRKFGSFVSTIFYFHYFRYQKNNTITNNTTTTTTTNYYTNMPKGRSLALQTVELQVRMCCTGCERVVRKAILKLRGIDSIEVDLAMEKVTVIGYVEHNKVLKAVRRSGKRAEFWPSPNPPMYFTSTNNYFKDMTNDYKESYNYWRHGYNVADRHGTLPASQRGDDKVSNMFNDDNVNACCLM